MNRIKFLTVCLLSISMFMFTSCDDEPLEGEFGNGNNGNGGPSVNCAESTQNLVSASSDFNSVSSNDPNYTSVCNSYANALQDQIADCGDETGVLQLLLDSLDCTSNVPDDCPAATADTQSAEIAYNADPTNNNLCAIYVTALQNQISICGDTNGDLQAIINGLDCNTNTPVILPRQIIQTYSDGSTIVSDFTFNGNKLIKFESVINFVGSATETLIEEYTYVDGLLILIDENFSDTNGNTEIIFSILEYNSSNQLIRETINFSANTQIDNYVHNADGTVTFNEEGGQIYIYTIENGNITLENNSNGPDDYTYTYDANNGVSKNIHAREVFTILGFSMYNNNLISYTNTGGSTFPENENSTYTYNADNYPITSTTVENQGTASEVSYASEYFYY